MSAKLIQALIDGQSELSLQILDTESVDIHARTAEGLTAMHLAAQRGYSNLIKKLHESGFSLDAKANNGRSALHECVLAKQTGALLTLISLGADVNSLDHGKQTPLHLAVLSTAYTQVRSLVQSNANTEITDNILKRPIDYATTEAHQRIRNFLKVPYNDDAASDTDSEDETDYNFTEMDSLTEKLGKLCINSTTQARTTNAIAHYRGLHFYEEYYDRQERKASRIFHCEQNSGDKMRVGIYSGATHEKAGVPVSVPEPSTDLYSREKKLADSNKVVLEKMSKLEQTGNVSPCLGTSNASRKSYENRSLELTQRYVNSYTALMSDMAEAPGKTTDNRATHRTKEKWRTYKALNFTKLPFVSTSEDVRWGLEYATAMLNWDKNGTYKPRLGGNVTVLTPNYQADGHCRFPYLGILYVILHTKRELTKTMSTRILDLFSEDKIDLSAGPGGHSKSGYVRARERIFVGGIDANHIKLAVQIRVPSFNQSYRDFIKEKYGMSKDIYEDFKNKLAKYGVKNAKGEVKNEREYNRTQQQIIQSVIESQKKRILEQVETIASSDGFKLGYLNVNKGQVCRSLTSIEKFEKKNIESKKNRLNK